MRLIMNKKAFIEESYNSAFKDELEKIAINDDQIIDAVSRGTNTGAALGGAYAFGKGKKFLPSIIKGALSGAAITATLGVLAKNIKPKKLD